MILEIPGLDVNKPSIKTRILEITTSYKVITAAKIQNVLLKKYNYKVTYQAVHKALHEMQKAKILVKMGKEYTISNSYISSLENFLSQLKKSKNSEFNIFEKKEMEKLNFENMYELFEFIVNALDLKYFTDEYRENYVWMKHFWQIPPSTPKRKIFQKWLDDSKTTVLVADNTIVDKIFAYYFKSKFFQNNKEGLRIKTGVKKSPSFELLIVNDTVIEIYFPKELLDKIDNLFSSFRKLVSPYITNEITEIAFMKTSINVVIIRNKEIADKYKEEIKKYF